MNIYSVLLLLLAPFLLFGQEIVSPTEFLGETYGTEFTPHHELVEYFKELDKASDQLTLEQYGETNEGRPLYLAFVSSKSNLEQIESIRKTNLFNAGLITDKPDVLIEKSIVWLSYSVHGNEAGGSEASMNVLYQLLKDNSKESWLDEAVVIIDPSLNPDGYERYTHWHRGIRGINVHPQLMDVEHMEPWPGGRVNHYLFDLNRDWAWQTQIESKQRIAKYNAWLPHIHADLHEMGYDDHYYFAPAAEPYHKAITDWQRDFQYEIGKNHAGYFDENGWLYFTREIFDLLYPSYGDTWPTFNGSIGMTYEQAGHGMAGRSIRMSNGKDLVLQDRIDHHTTTSLSTIEMAVKNQAQMINQFKDYFRNSKSRPSGKYKHYIVKEGANSEEFAKLLDKNDIQYSYVQEFKKLKAYSYNEKSVGDFDAEKGDIYISAYQAKSTLLQVFMEEEPILADSVTYDITSWCIPLAYGLDCYAFTAEPNVEVDKEQVMDATDFSIGKVGVAIPWNQTKGVEMVLGHLLLKDLVVKSAQKQIELENLNLKRGDLLVLKADQKESIDWQEILVKIALDLEVEMLPIENGFAISGSDLGGSGLQMISKPNVLTIFGDGVDANAYGQVWYYFEQVLKYPISRVDISSLSYIDLDQINTLILPDGYYSLSEDLLTKISEWVSSGGKLISIGGANRNLLSSDLFAIAKDESSTSDSESDHENRYKKRAYEGAERRSISGSIPGAIFKTKVDSTHPLCYGMNSYYTLKNSSRRIPLIGGNGFNPVFIPKDYTSYGFIGSELSGSFDESTVFAVERKGKGVVIYMVDNPLFRAFWKSGELIFANALFQVK